MVKTKFELPSVHKSCDIRGNFQKSSQVLNFAAELLCMSKTDVFGKMKTHIFLY